MSYLIILHAYIIKKILMLDLICNNVIILILKLQIIVNDFKVIFALYILKFLIDVL